MDTGALSLLIGGICTGIAGIITAGAVAVRAWRPMSRSATAARRLYEWLADHDLSDLVPGDLFRAGMTPEELAAAYEQLRRSSVLDTIPHKIRRQVEKAIDWGDKDDKERHDGET